MSATEQRNVDISNWKSTKNPHNRFEKNRSECWLMSKSQNASTCIVDGVHWWRKLESPLLGNWYYLRASLHSFQDESFCKNWKTNRESSIKVSLQPHDIKSLTESGVIGSSVVSEAKPPPRTVQQYSIGSRSDVNPSVNRYFLARAYHHFELAVLTLH